MWGLFDRQGAVEVSDGAGDAWLDTEMPAATRP
jgi:hypothetical protein